MRWFRTILAKLLFAFTVPTAVLFLGFAVVVHEVARDQLEQELSSRLQVAASAGAANIRGRYLTGLEAGEEDDRAYLNARRKLKELVARTKIARAYIFDRDFGLKVSSDRDGVGSRVFQAELDRAEIKTVFDTGQAISTLLFTGYDGREYKAGYAPVHASERDPKVVLALGVEAAPTYFLRLAELRRTLIVYGFVTLFVAVVLAIIVSAIITRGVRTLATAAEQIGRGQLSAPIRVRARDEIGVLGATMEHMRVELQKRDTQMQMMIAGIAHEVRNPLAGIQLYSGILRNELAPELGQQAHLDRIDKELGYLENVVQGFLAYARRASPQLVATDLSAVVLDVIEIMKPECDAGNIELRVETEPADVEIDPVQMRSVCLNILRNAVEAVSEQPDGRIDICVNSRVDEVVATFSNNGPRIADEHVERLFEPFFTTRAKGTGLGLALAFEIVCDHGGTITLQSREADTRFTIRLPTAIT